MDNNHYVYEKVRAAEKYEQDYKNDQCTMRERERKGYGFEFLDDTIQGNRHQRRKHKALQRKKR